MGDPLVYPPDSHISDKTGQKDQPCSAQFAQRSDGQKGSTPRSMPLPRRINVGIGQIWHYWPTVKRERERGTSGKTETRPSPTVRYATHRLSAVSLPVRYLRVGQCGSGCTYGCTREGVVGYVHPGIYHPGYTSYTPPRVYLSYTPPRVYQGVHIPPRV